VIFVTVGTYRFDALVEEVDRLVGEGRLPDKTIVQLAHGKFQPRHCEWFRMARTIEPYLRDATLVITHGGSTMHQALAMGKRVIAVPNTELADDHQSGHVRKLAEEGYLLYCGQLKDLAAVIHGTKEIRPYETDADALVRDIYEFIG
jgi:UDP-N-acetylglucosamine transferase subunit ALG13